MPPSVLLGQQRTLRFASKLARHSWLFELIIFPVIRLGASEALDRLLRAGPLCRMTRLLGRHSGAMFPGKTSDDPKLLWTRAHDTPETDWLSRVDAAILAAFQVWRAAKELEYPEEYRAYLHQCRSPTPTSARLWLRVGGDRAKVVLRLKSPALRLHPRGEPRAPCAWCNQAPECGAHVLECPHTPGLVAATLMSARSAIAIESRRPLATSPSAMLSMSWPHQSEATINLVLDAMCDALAAYRLSVPREPDTGRCPIWPVPRSR
jgi:hypothetical protein